MLGSFWVRLAASGYYLLFFVLYASMFVGFAFESRVAAFLVVGALVGTLAVHIAVALLNYRHVMPARMAQGRAAGRRRLVMGT